MSSCAQIHVSGGGSKTPTNLVSFPGAYKATVRAFLSLPPFLRFRITTVVAPFHSRACLGAEANLGTRSIGSRAYDQHLQQRWKGLPAGWAQRLHLLKPSRGAEDAVVWPNVAMPPERTRAWTRGMQAWPLL